MSLGLIAELRAFALGVRGAPRKGAAALPAEAPPPEDLLASTRGALERIATEREAANAELASMDARRRDLLLSDAPDPDFVALDAEADSQRRKLDKLDLLEPELRGRLEALETEAAGERAEQLKSERDAAAREYAEALSDALPKMIRLAELEQRGHALPSPYKVTGLSVIPRVMDPDAIAIFVGQVERLGAGAAAKPSIDRVTIRILKQPATAWPRSIEGDYVGGVFPGDLVSHRRATAEALVRAGLAEWTDDADAATYVAAPAFAVRPNDWKLPEPGHDGRISVTFDHNGFKSLAGLGAVKGDCQRLKPEDARRAVSGGYAHPIEED